MYSPAVIHEILFEALCTLPSAQHCLMCMLCSSAFLPRGLSIFTSTSLLLYFNMVFLFSISLLQWECFISLSLSCVYWLVWSDDTTACVTNDFICVVLCVCGVCVCVCVWCVRVCVCCVRVCVVCACECVCGVCVCVCVVCVLCVLCLTLCEGHYYFTT